MSDTPKQGWTDGPNTRGTYDILWTCLATLALCVWTAVHPNILRSPSSRRALLTRLAMMVIAIVFPEFIISAAWRQLRSSGWLRKQINTLNHLQLEAKERVSRQSNHRSSIVESEPRRQLLTPAFESISLEIGEASHLTRRTSTISSKAVERTETDASKITIDSTSKQIPSTTEQIKRSAEEQPPRRQAEWTSQQAFFAVMGGFAIENQYFEEWAEKVVVLRRLVTTEGVFELAKLGWLPKISPEDIEERSKADIIAKAFVLSQITWFGLQVIGRLTSKIPVTPLETHTAIHVACTVVIYFMWLKKPYDVRSSILLSAPEVKDFGALCEVYEITERLHVNKWTRYQSVRAQYWKNRVVHAGESWLDPSPPPSPPVKLGLTALVDHYKSIDAVDEGEDPGSMIDGHVLIALAPAAKRCIERLKERDNVSDDTINSENWGFLRESSENFTMRAVWGGWSTDTGHDLSLDKVVHFMFNFLYGGGHLAAWQSSSFPTEVEKWLWRGSAIMLTLVPLWGGLWISWWAAARSRQRWLYLIRNGDLDIVVAPFFFVIILAYFFARAFLLIESLISLRLLPIGAFLKVEWIEYLPHIA